MPGAERRRRRCQLRPHGRVDRRAPHRRDGPTDAAVNKDRAVDLDHRVVLAEPAAVLALGSERDLHLDPTERRLVEEAGAEGGLVERLIGGFRASGRIAQNRAIVPLAQLLGVGRPEGRVLPGADVPQVAQHPHDLVIAEQDVHASAGLRGLTLHAAQEIQCPARVRSAVQHVARLHEDGASAGPVLAAVDESCCSQNRDEAVVGAVYVSDGDNAFGRFDGARRRGDVLSGVREGAVRKEYGSGNRKRYPAGPDPKSWRREHGTILRSWPAPPVYFTCPGRF